MASPGAPSPSVDHHREPCPDRILDDIGGAFSMGAIGGGMFHAGKQLIWGPKAYKMRSALEVRPSKPSADQGRPLRTCQHHLRGIHVGLASVKPYAVQRGPQALPHSLVVCLGIPCLPVLCRVLVRV